MAKWDRRRGRPEPISALNKILEIDSFEPLVDLTLACPDVVILRPQVIAYLRKTAAEMLQEACVSLAPHFKIGVIDAFRPFQRQVRIYEYMTKCALEVWPDLDYAQLRRRVNRWVAPIDQPAPPGHCTGAAVDVYLLNADGEEQDVASPYDRFSAAPTYSYGLTETAKKNRELLVNSMLSVGFSNCRDEWWHYSYGDAGWAVRLERAACFYGLIELEPEYYAHQEEMWIQSFQERRNPFAARD